MDKKSGCCPQCRLVAVIILLFLGVCFLAAGLFLKEGDVFSDLIRKQVDKNVMLKPGTLVYKNWEKPSSPIYLQFFVFDLTNPEEVFEGLEKPFVRQKGPYSYKEIRTNNVISWNNDSSEVTFMPNRSYIFDPETSCHNCNDKIDKFTTVNIPLMSLITFMESRLDVYADGLACHGLIKLLVNVFVNPKPTLFHELSVHEMIWGYTDPMLKRIYEDHGLPIVKNCPIPADLTPLVQLQKNNTYFGISTVNTGQKDIDLLEQYTMWRNERKLSWWSDKYANMINGTDGSQMKPNLPKDEIIYAFAPEVCRSVYAVYEKTTKIRDIELYRYSAPDELYKSGDVYPPNKGFCVPPGCLPSGLLNISRCQPMNPPVVVSPPHFYQCNSSLLDTVDGLHPDKDLHGTHIDVEPITGITMNANKRIQINIAVHPSSLLTPTDGKFEPVFLPLMYVNEKAEIDEHDASQFKKTVYTPILLTEVVEWGLVALGGTLIIVAVFLRVCRPRRSSSIQLVDENSPLLNDKK